MLRKEMQVHDREGSPREVCSSIGICLFLRAGDKSVAELLKHADSAMSAAEMTQLLKR